MTVKSYDTFLAENLAGEYCYYGPGSLYPIVAKLAAEGKDDAFVYRYLTSLGIDERRKRDVIRRAFGYLYEGQVFEDAIDDLVSTDAEDAIADVTGKDKEKDKEKDDKTDDKEDDKKSKDDDEKDSEDDAAETLRKMLDSYEKLEQIKKILGESFAEAVMLRLFEGRTSQSDMKEALAKMDKWMPDDREIQKDFYNAVDNGDAEEVESILMDSANEEALQRYYTGPIEPLVKYILKNF